MTRTCKKCQQEQPINHFGKAGNGYRRECKSCVKLRMQQWQRNYREKMGYGYSSRPAQKRIKLKHLYGLDLDPKDLPTRCQLCGYEPDRSICVDHCHSTGRVRGFLCHQCNTILGLAKDDPNLLRRLANYLEK